MIGTERDDQQDDRDGRPEPDQARLADAVVRDQDRQQLEAVLAAVDDVGDVEGAQRLDDGDDDDDDVDRAHDREDHPEEGLALVRAVDRGGLAEGRVDALQPGQVQDHHVADVAPAGGDQDGPEVEVRVAEPVDDVVLSWSGPRTLLMNPCDVYSCSQMNPTMASDRTTGRKNALW